MRQMTVALVCLAAAVPVEADAALEVRVSTNPRSPLVGQLTRIELRTYVPFMRRDGSCCRLKPGGPRRYPFRVQAVSPHGRAFRLRVTHVRRNVWAGTFRFGREGRWQVRVANYGPSYRHAPGARPRLSVRVRTRPPTPPPAGFGPLGQPGCNPPSPRHRADDFFAAAEVFGTSFGGAFWALFAFQPASSWASADAAVFDGLVGRELKVVCRLTGGWPSSFRAFGPTGALSPRWSQPHAGSDWQRPGYEWGAGFVFPQAGCWEIQAEHAPTLTSGTVSLLIRS